MTKSPILYSKGQKGFGLIEVLITVVILGIGLLGLAGLQATGLNFNHSAYNRSQATILAYDIIDRMRANPAAIGSYTGAPVQTANCVAIAGCTPVQMAQHDLFEWQTSIDATLSPGGAAAGAVGTIAFDGTIFDITITWDENRDNVIDGDTNGPDPFFQVSFQP
jgi:type IV pilus assembly protein PilV